MRKSSWWLTVKMSEIAPQDLKRTFRTVSISLGIIAPPSQCRLRHTQSSKRENLKPADSHRSATVRSVSAAYFTRDGPPSAL